MVAVHATRVDHHFMPTRRFPDQLAALLTDIPAKHLILVFCDPHEVIFAAPNRVAAAFVRFHNRSPHGNRTNPMPAKTVGFTDPLSGTLK